MTTARDICRQVVAEENADLLNLNTDTFRRWHAIGLIVIVLAGGVWAWFRFVKPYFAWNVLG